MIKIIKILGRLVYTILFDNKIADAEERLYFGDKYDSKEK
jgi:hypothetical protein